jgi:succinylglutamic semialdehyde dehydrogenase
VSAGHHPALTRGPANLIGGQWHELGSAVAGETTGDGSVESRNPANPSRVVFSAATRIADVDRAIAAAGAALPAWSAWPIDRRAGVLRRFRDLCKSRESSIADLISDETGKALWDAKAEASLLANKVEITLDDSATGPLRRVTGFELNLAGSRTGRCWFRPHGVMAVVGPFNFPVHLPNGHIVPALLMGNTIVLKPSDKAPACGQILVELLDEALRTEGAPPGVVNLVQGGVDVAKRIANHDDLDGILFTGSWPVGRAIMQANLDRPGRLLALEMGGNNPAMVLPDADLKQAAIECVRSAFISTGQRCTCTRRLIVHRAIADRFVPAVLKAASNLIVGDPRSANGAPVFMGPIIGESARQAVLDAQRAMVRAGGRLLLESTAMPSASGGWYITPGVVEVERFSRATGLIDDAGADVETFGPLLRVSVVDSLDDAIAQANSTDFGLAASLFTKDQVSIDRFLREAHAGCVNINTGTAGASSKLPFGGLGRSGNHRPAGAFSLDYCAVPIAGMIEQGDGATMPQGMRFDDSWLGG